MCLGRIFTSAFVRCVTNGFDDNMHYQLYKTQEQADTPCNIRFKSSSDKTRIA